jgi:hypothetical protein
VRAGERGHGPLLLLLLLLLVLLLVLVLLLLTDKCSQVNEDTGRCREHEAHTRRPVFLDSHVYLSCPDAGDTCTWTH